MPSVTKINRPWIKKAETQSEKKTDKFYHSSSWRKLRAYILACEPLCYYCQLSGQKRLATIGDHFRPRKLFPELQLIHSNIKGSCDHHHNQKRNWESKQASKEQFERNIEAFLNKMR
jgi:5-methylcytosine-specific restriction endonuclease McrA